MLLHLGTETDGQFQATSLAFQHQPDDPGAVEQILGCPVAINAPENHVVVSAAMWTLSLRHRDPVLRQMLEDILWTVDTNKDFRIAQFRVYEQ